MTTHPAPVAVATVVAATWALSRTSRGWCTDRTRARVGIPTRPPRPGPVTVQRALTSAAVDVDARTALHLWGTAVAVACAAALVMGGGPVLVATALLGPPAAVVAARHRERRRRTAQLPLALEAVASGMRGGAALRIAIADAAALGGPLGDELDRIATHAAGGRPLPEVLAEWADGGTGADTRLAGAALVLAAELGGPGADAVDAAARSLRERAAADDEIAALSVQARLSAGLLTVAPLCFSFLLASLDPTSARFLFGTRAGWACIAVGLVLDLLGAMWMARLVRSSG